MLEPLPVQVAYTHGEQQLQLSQVCFILSRHNLDCEGQKKKTGALYPETAHEELRL
jgi:hypothetical protein